MSVVGEHTSAGLSEVKVDGGEYLLHKSGCVCTVFVCLQCGNCLQQKVFKLHSVMNNYAQVCEQQA